MRKHRLAAFLAMFAAALTLVLGAVPAQALTGNETAKITLSSDSDAKMTGYKIIDYRFEDGAPVGSGFYWNDDFAAEVKNVNSSWIDDKNDNAVTEAYANAKASELEELYGALAAYAATASVVPVNDVPLNHIDNLPMGGYLITTASVNYIYKPIVCTIAPAWDQDNREWTFAREISIDAKLKREELSIDKKVGSAAPGDDNILSGNYNGAVGDNVLFKLTSDVPTYPANAINKKYVIADQLSGGLTFPDRPSNISLSNFTIKFFRDDQSEVNLDSAVPNIVTLGTKGLDGKTYTFALSFDMDKLQQHGVKKIEVSYIAKINKDAVVGNPGNPNDVLLQYSNNPYGDDSYKTKQDKVEVYTYGLRVLKVDAANKATVLPGAKFVLSTLQDGDNISGHMYFDKEEDGTYVPTGEMTPLSSTELVTDVDGLIKIKGLNEGTYYLHETEAPGGYNKLDKPVVVTITDKVNSDLDGDILEQTDQSGTGTAGITVENHTGFTLPTTGGMGTAVFAAAGVVLVGGGVALYHTIRKREQR